MSKAPDTQASGPDGDGGPKPLTALSLASSALIFLAIMAILFPFALTGVTDARGALLDKRAEELSAKHGVEFTVGNHRERELFTWIVDGVERECLVTDPALLCVDGEVYEF